MQERLIIGFSKFASSVSKIVSSTYCNASTSLPLVIERLLMMLNSNWSTKKALLVVACFYGESI